MFALTLTMVVSALPGQSQPAEWEYYASPMLLASHVALQGDDIWVGGEHGLMRYRRSTGERTPFSTTNAGLPGGHITALLAGEDHLWVGTARGLALLDRGEWTVFTAANSPLPSDTIHALARGPSGDLWVGTEQGLARLNTEGWTVYTARNSGLLYHQVHSLGFDNAGVLWIGAGETLTHFDGEHWAFMYVRRAPNAFVSIGDREVWVAMHGFGVCVYIDYEINRCYHSLTPVRPAGDVVTSIAVDAQGRVWAGANEGLSYWDGEDWIRVPDRFGRLDHLTALVFADNGDLWVAGNGSGLKRVRDRLVEFIPTGNEMGLVGGAAIAAVGDAVWIATEKGLVEVQGGGWSLHPAPSGMATNVKGIDVDARGHVWLALFGGGLVEYTGERWVRHPPPTYDATFAWSVAVEPSGAVWLGGMGGQFTGSGAARYANGAWTHFSSANAPFRDNRVWDIEVASDGSVWMGTSEGVVRYDGATWEHHDTQVGEVVLGLAEGPDGRIWAATWKGLAVYDGASWRHEPIPDLETEWGTFTRDVAVDAQGRVWAAAFQGFAVLEDGVWTAYTPTTSRLPHHDVERVVVTDDGVGWLSLYTHGALRFRPGEETPRWSEPSGIPRVVAEEPWKAPMTSPLAIEAAYPNPARGAVTIHYAVEQVGPVTLEVLDLLGRRVALLREGGASAGQHEARWEAAGAGGGVYILRLTSGGGQAMRRVTLLP